MKRSKLFIPFFNLKGYKYFKKVHITRNCSHFVTGGNYSIDCITKNISNSRK